MFSLLYDDVNNKLKSYSVTGRHFKHKQIKKELLI